MRGLETFISDLRKCRCEGDEIKRIYKELANIRSKFKGVKPLSGYHKKKYTCKLLFMFLLGHSCDFGHMVAVNLLSSNAYSEKQIGYLFTSVVMGKDHNFMPFVLNALKNDFSSNNENFQNLALQFVANNATKHMSELLGNQVLELLISCSAADFVKQSAALAFLQVLRNKPDIISSKQIAISVIDLISSPDLGVVTASVSLVEFLVCTYPSEYYDSCVFHAVISLSRIITSSCIDLYNYSYYHTNAPWLCVKLLQLLQNFPAPSDRDIRLRLKESLHLILNSAQQTPKSNKFQHNNTKYAVVFEAVSTIIHMNINSYLVHRAINILGTVLKQKEPNLRYMSLDLMTKVPDNQYVKDNIATHWESVLNVLRTEEDITIKKSAVNLLYRICDITNVKPIVEEFLCFIEKEEDETIHEEVVLKSASLAEHLKADLKWYVDTIFNILQVCTDNVNDNIWYSLVKVVIDNAVVQGYAARKAFTVLLQNPCKDLVVKAAGYILGEFGFLIVKYSGCSQLQQLNILQQKFASSSPSTRALLLTTYMKYLNIYPDLKDQIQSIFRDNSNFCSQNEEIQQRAVEYLNLSQISSKSNLAAIFEKMPSSQHEKSAVSEALENKNSQIYGDSSISLADKNLIKYHSMSNIRNITETVNERRVQVSVAQSHANLRTQYLPSFNVIVEILNKNSTESENLAASQLSKPFFGLPPILSTLEYSNEVFIQNLLFNEIGILYQDGKIKISIESQFMKHHGKFCLMYINKSNRDLKNFSVEGNFASMQDKCLIEIQPCCSYLQRNQSMRHDILVECLNEFTKSPSLNLKFRYDNNQREIKIILPLTVNKFVEPATMSSELFKERWQTLGCYGHEAVKYFDAKYPMIYEETLTKLKKFPVGVIEDVGNISCRLYFSGIFFARMCQIGFLVLLEQYPVAKRYCSIVRSNQRSFSPIICNLLSELL